MKVPSNLRSPLAETGFFVVYLCLMALGLVQFAAFNLNNPEFRIGPLVLALAPSAALYLLFRLIVGPVVSLGFSVGLGGILASVNHFKLAFTGMPLSWGDLATSQNLPIVLTYLNRVNVLLLIVVMFAATVLLVIAMKREHAVATLRGKIVAVCLLLIVSPIAFQPYLADAPWNMGGGVGRFLERQGIYYTPGDWRINVSANGLFFHLIQTSRRTVPAKLSQQERAMLIALSPSPPLQREPAHVFFVLCEACWHDDANFSDAFDPLRRLGFLPMRGISPAYGGGTVNASFEMLTAMPSRGALTGVIYQEYGLVMSSQAHTIVSGLRSRGYDTYALHNFMKEFWLRHIVLQKFGFDEFLGIEDMNYDGDGPYPKDRILYGQALQILKRSPERKAFFSLETVYSHWPYPFKNDSGEGDYRTRLGLAVNDMAEFIQAVRVISPDALFVIYGDHKPALTKYFYEKGVLPAEMFAQIGEKSEDFIFQHDLDQQILGDVPVWVGGGGQDAGTLHQVRDLAQGKPLYCIAAIFDALLLGSQSPASRYSLQNICTSYTHYLEGARKMPAWLYSAMLFHPVQAE